MRLSHCTIETRDRTEFIPPVLLYHGTLGSDPACWLNPTTVHPVHGTFEKGCD